MVFPAFIDLTFSLVLIPSTDVSRRPTPKLFHAETLTASPEQYVDTAQPSSIRFDRFSILPAAFGLSPLAFTAENKPRCDYRRRPFLKYARGVRPNEAACFDRSTKIR
jgi:hypothetical protein